MQKLVLKKRFPKSYSIAVHVYSLHLPSIEIFTNFRRGRGSFHRSTGFSIQDIASLHDVLSNYFLVKSWISRGALQVKTTDEFFFFFRWFYESGIDQLFFTLDAGNLNLLAVVVCIITIQTLKSLFLFLR